ncbi:hypothetical protein PVK06_000791 [Gossypium arboreum]|uniref:RNase H type-1 domain-containing protein n=1 Tax=Gossypium arboreum TaxID=29729 RepID=A0ABR0QZD2_GOSAR|nr:hypothetical protein PVK06_000791 [Gossypium arboreum]
MQIPLASSSHEDFFSWGGEASGEYIVRSGSKLLLQRHENYRYNEINRCYKKLWRSDLRSKINITAWRATLNYLPTLINLRAKRLITEASCQRYKQGLETREHVFRDYAITKETWETLAQWKQVELSSALYGLYGRLGTNGCTKATGDRIIVSNSNGEVIGSRFKVHTNICSSFAAEAIACLQAIQVGHELGLKQVIIEGDSLTVIKKVQNPKRDRSEIGPFIFDIKNQKAGFHKCQFQHINRSANITAHNLASEGLKMGKNTYLAPWILQKRQ